MIVIYLSCNCRVYVIADSPQGAYNNYIMWKMFNPNPGGLQTIDCTVRAVCAVTGLDWEMAHKLLCDFSRVLYTMPSADSAWWEFLKGIGFTQYGLIDQCPDCYTVADFAVDHPHGVYVLGPKQHAVAVIDGEYWDSWDSGNTVPTYFFRRK